MGFLETVVIGGYLYTTGVFLWLQDKVSKINRNHLKHAEAAINETRIHVGLPPVNLTEPRE
jgi:hypothetical protein